MDRRNVKVVVVHPSCSVSLRPSLGSCLHCLRGSVVRLLGFVAGRSGIVLGEFGRGALSCLFRCLIGIDFHLLRLLSGRFLHALGECVLLFVQFSGVVFLCPLASVDGGPDGIALEQPHRLAVVLFVHREPVVDPGRQSDEVSLQDFNADPAVRFVPDIKIPGALHHVPHLWVGMNVLFVETLQLCLVVWQLVRAARHHV
mmetsp:Transcript_45603/g.89821  ORF Transcript_45603/g.89821 Transcript_45603/m.89821 type:complete len:200 (-) Transcript_45603:347-946(-)